MKEPSNDYDALVMALQNLKEVLSMAEDIASRLSEFEVERAKKEAERNLCESIG